MENKKTNRPSVSYGILGRAATTLNDSYQFLEKKFWTLIVISFVGSVAYSGLAAGIAFAVSSIFALPPSASWLSRLAILLPSLVLSVGALALQIWSGLALITAAYSEDKPTIRNSYLISRNKFVAYAWSGFLAIAIIAAGLAFFIIPGIVASIWFAITTVVVVTENKRGIEALFASKDLVRGRLRETAVFLAYVMAVLAVVFYASLALRLPQGLWSIFINTLGGAFYATSLVALYRHLSATKGKITSDGSTKRKQQYAFIAFIGSLILAGMVGMIIFASVKFGNDAIRILEADQIQQALALYDQKQGTFPQNLSRLVPDYLSGVPADPASRKPFDYAPTNDGKDYALIINYDSFGIQTLTANSSPIPSEK